MGRHHDLGHVEHRRHLGAVQRPGTAEGDQREVARVEPLLHRLGADGIRHVGIDDGEHPFGGLVPVDAERLCEAGERRIGPLGRERHLAAEEVVRVQPAEHEVGVGHRRRLAAPAVAGGAGLGARALRPYLEGAARVDARDAAAARTDGRDVDHRHQHRVAADPGVARGGLAVAAVDHDADVGAGAAHVEGDEAPPLRMRRRPGAAQHAGGRPRHEGDDRHVRHHRRRRDAAVGAHDVEVAGDPGLLQPALEAAHVIAHLGADEGVHRRRGEALELAELRRHTGRGGDEGLRPFLQHDGARALLVAGVDVGEEEADGDRLHALLAQRPRSLAHALLVQRLQHLALRRHPPLAHGHAVAPAHQRARLPGDVLHDRVVLRALVAADMDDVAVAGRGDHAGHGAVVLQHRVGRDRGAVEDVGDRFGRGAAPLAELGDACRGPFGGVVRGRGHLVDRALARLAVGDDEVCEGAADIDADQLHGPFARSRGPAAAGDGRSSAASRRRQPAVSSPRESGSSAPGTDRPASSLPTS